MKCERCGYDDNGTGDFAHSCAPFRTEPAGSADQVNDAVEMVDDSPGIVWKVTFLDGSSCHYGVKSTAQAAAGKCGTIEAIELKDKRFRLVEPAGSAEPISEQIDALVKQARERIPSPLATRSYLLTPIQIAYVAGKLAQSAGSTKKVLQALSTIAYLAGDIEDDSLHNEIKDKVRIAAEALSTQSTHQQNVSIKAGEID